MIARLLSRRSFILANAGVVVLLLAAPASVLAAQGGGQGPNHGSPGASAVHGNSGNQGTGTSNSSSSSSLDSSNSNSPGSNGGSQGNSGNQGTGTSNSSSSSNLNSSNSNSSGSNGGSQGNSKGNDGPPGTTTGTNSSQKGSSPSGNQSGANSGFSGNSNHGDVWVDNVGQPAGPGHEMDPHLACANINLWGNGMADSTGGYTIDGWSPSGSGFGDQAWPGTKAAPGTAAWTYPAGGDQVMSVINVQTLINDANANGDAPINGQGYHFKLQFVQDPQKHKTFWVNCHTPSPTPSGPAVSVYKTNDANGTGYAVTEDATVARENVDFQALITNTSSESETIGSITDSYGSTTMEVCSGGTSPGNVLTNKVLAPGAQVTCTFTIDGYAPTVGSALTDTVQVVATDANHKTASAAASSTVITASVSNLPAVSVYKTNDANGSFGMTEYATGTGETVDFHALITNTSSESETIGSITDSYGSTTMEVCSDGRTPGNDLRGTLLAPGGQVTCAFTIAGYAPAVGSALTDTVQVVVTDANHKTASAAASSTVITLPSSSPSGPDLIVTKSVSATTATIGQTLTYNITVSNVGRATANDVVMTDQMGGSAGFQVNDSSDQTADSFVGDPGVQVTNTGRGDYTWTYNSIPTGSTYTVTYTATILSPGTTSNILNGVETLNNTVTATPGAPGGCSGTSCTSTVTTTAPVPNGNVKGASTTKPSGGVLGASTTSTPGTGAHLDLLLTLILVLAGLTLIGFAIATRPRATPQA